MTSDLNSTEPAATPTDVLLGRVVIVLAIVIVLDVLGIVLLAYAAKAVPDALVGTLGSAVTGLGVLLVGRRT